MDIGNEYFKAHVPERLAEAVGEAAARMEEDGIIRRIWDRDWTVWKDEDREISSRLGWLDAPACPPEEVRLYTGFADSLKKEGVSRVVLLGMGGSSLAAEAFGRVLDRAEGFPDLEVLDTTAPETIIESFGRTDFERTIFMVSSKSGTTAESNALLCLFYYAALERLGKRRAGRRFVAVTDPGSPLESVARSLGFRDVFHGRKDVGGRFSALTAFGLLPAACCGVPLEPLLTSAVEAAEACRREQVLKNPGAVLGLLAGLSAAKGADKLTVCCPPRLKPVFDWLEQLTAESTGKEGRGIVPVYGGAKDDSFAIEFLEDRSGSSSAGTGIRAVFGPDVPGSLGGLFFVLETAVAVACRFLGVNPFDQPDVEASKRKTREFIASGPGTVESGPEPGLAPFLKKAGPGSYIALQAFLPPSPEMARALEELAGSIAAVTGRPVTSGFGPRFLHSTGQLHKGGANNGLFIQIVPASRALLPIPEIEGVTRPAASFDALITAQAWGDLTALREKGRRVVRLTLLRSDAASLREAVRSILR